MKSHKAQRSKKGRSANKAPLMEHVLTLAGPRFPPAISFARKETQWRRFNQTAAVANQAFSLANGHDQFLVVTTVGGNAVPYVDSWRIRRIRVWCLSANDTSTTATLTPTGTDITSNMRNDRESIFSITSRSTADPGYMEIRTSKTQPLGSWHFTSATNFAGTLFNFTVAVGGGAALSRVTMDIEFETITNYAGLPLGYGVVTSTTTLGTVGGRNILSGMSLQGINSLG